MGNMMDEIDVFVFSEFFKKRTLFLTGEIDDILATDLSAKMLYLDSKSKKQITLYINSPGGQLSGMITIYDTIQQLASPLKVICIGEASSAAAVLLSAGTKGLRYAYPNSEIMIHDLRLEVEWGAFSDVKHEVKRCEDFNLKMLKIISLHTGQPLKKVRKDCLKDKFFTPEEAIKYGLIDHILHSKK